MRSAISEQPANGLKGRILVVDDDRDFADGLQNFLILQDYDVAVAYDANSATQKIEDFDAQIAIIDYRLGASIGVDLVGPLTRSRPRLICLLATAYSDTEVAVHALRRGVYDYLQKPLRMSDLASVLDRCFDRYRLEDAKLAAEQALAEAQKFESLAQVAGGVAHNFNNLLTTLVGGLSLLKDDLPVGSEQYALADRAIMAAEKAAKINHSLVAYARNQLLNPEAFDPNDVVLDVTTSLRDAVPDFVQIQSRTSDRHARAHADRSRYETCLRLLIQNALEAMQDGGEIVIETGTHQVSGTDLSVYSDLAPGSYVTTRISDTGYGMPPEAVERAFEPFYSAKGLAERTGLGLSVAYGFAKQSGGDITLESTEGEGTSITLLLPAADEH